MDKKELWATRKGNERDAYGHPKKHDYVSKYDVEPTPAEMLIAKNKLSSLSGSELTRVTNIHIDPKALEATIKIIQERGGITGGYKSRRRPSKKGSKRRSKVSKRRSKVSKRRSKVSKRRSKVSKRRSKDALKDALKDGK